jgi:RNA polymerase sigma factor (sigma-70 family)
MHPHRASRPNSSFLLNSTDRLGREIDPAVLSAAQQISSTAIRYAERLLGDPALATTLLEEAAATVSHALREKASNGNAGVENLEAYLFQAFLRLISKEKHTEISFDEAHEYEGASQPLTQQEHCIEQSVLLEEVLATCDRVTRYIVLRRLEGFSWKEIAEACGIRSDAARQRFSAALHKLRKAFRGRGQVS